MSINFYREDTQAFLFSTNTEDVAGLLAAVQGDYIDFLSDTYRYSTHIFVYRLDNAVPVVEVNVLVNPYVV